MTSEPHRRGPDADTAIADVSNAQKRGRALTFAQDTRGHRRGGNHESSIRIATADEYHVKPGNRSGAEGAIVMTTSVETSTRVTSDDHQIIGLLDGPAERSPVRLVAAAAAAGMAVAHIPVIKEHLDEAPYVGIGFVLLTIAGLMLLQLLLTRDTVAVWASSLVVSALALLGYLVSRTVGLPQITDDIGNWSDPLGVVAIVSETVLLLAAVGHLTNRKHRLH